MSDFPNTKTVDILSGATRVYMATELHLFSFPISSNA